jgi:hypothetical protein
MNNQQENQPDQSIPANNVIHRVPREYGRLVKASRILIIAACGYGITTTRGIAEDKNWGDRQTTNGIKSDKVQRTIETQKKPSTNNVRAQSAKAKAIKTHIQTLHQQISDIYSKRHDVISDKRKPQNERNQESKKLLDQAKALEENLNKAAEQYQQILSSTSILN